MHRIDTPTAQVDKFGAGKNGFSAGNPQTGELPTALDQDYFDAIQEEIAAVIESAAIALAKGNRSQLLTAMKKLFLQPGNNLSEIVDAVAALNKLGGAPLASPTFTGTPKGPTAAAGTNNTQIATTAFVQALIAGLLKTSNNLSEIAAAGPAAVASALTNLGLGEVATENIVPVNKGGTGASGRAGAVSGLGLLLQNRWISAAQTMTLGVPITLTHGLPITDPLTCYSDVMIVCSTANSGYSVGDVAIGPQMVDGASSSVNRTISCTPALSATTIQLNVGASGIYIVNKTNGTITPLATLTGWRVYFRIFY